MYFRKLIAASQTFPPANLPCWRDLAKVTSLLWFGYWFQKIKECNHTPRCHALYHSYPATCTICKQLHYWYLYLSSLHQQWHSKDILLSAYNNIIKTIITNWPIVCGLYLIFPYSIYLGGMLRRMMMINVQLILSAFFSNCSIWAIS